MKLLPEICDELATGDVVMVDAAAIVDDALILDNVSLESVDSDKAAELAPELLGATVLVEVLPR